MSEIKKFRAGGWLPHDREHIDIWVRDLKIRAAKNPQPLIEPIQEFKNMVATDPVLNFTCEAMFNEAALLRQQTPLGTPEIKNFDEFLTLLNEIMTQAPEYTECPNAKTGEEEACGLIGFPINALLDWPMATSFGYDFFSNTLVNQQFKKILNKWSEFLETKDSRSVLVDNFPERTPKVLAWLSSTAKQEMVDVACQASKDPCSCKKKTFEDFFNCNPDDKYYGYKSWDDFFTRTFRADVRPVVGMDDDKVIANACESAPLVVKNNVDDSTEFWLKGQPYSLQNMMNFDPLAKNFNGGTVYQAFLSALSYHRWNSPVNGKVKKAFVVNGTYYLENRFQGFINKDGGDPSAPNDSQPFLTAVATRAVIFIEADNPDIGLMCFIAVGMAEVSSCEITVNEGQQLNKGDELGMFHFGGSTHCLIFGPDVVLDFDFHNNKKPGLDSTNIPVRSCIATVKNI